jgi:general secretion pathway protein E
VQAALTGHLVFSSLHTNDAPSAVTRLIDIGIKPYMINSVLLAVVAQRLVRKLCPQCKAEVDFSDEEWKQLIQPFKSEKPKKIYQAVGCTDCRHTGYKGRTGIYEMMPYSPTLQGMVTRGANMHELRKQALKEGMKALRLSGLQKVADGVTSIEEVVRVTPIALDE